MMASDVGMRAALNATARRRVVVKAACDMCRKRKLKVCSRRVRQSCDIVHVCVRSDGFSSALQSVLNASAVGSQVLNALTLPRVKRRLALRPPTADGHCVNRDWQPTTKFSVSSGELPRPRPKPSTENYVRAQMWRNYQLEFESAMRWPKRGWCLIHATSTTSRPALASQLSFKPHETRTSPR